MATGVQGRKCRGRRGTDQILRDINFGLCSPDVPPGLSLACQEGRQDVVDAILKAKRNGSPIDCLCPDDLGRSVFFYLCERDAKLPENSKEKETNFGLIRAFLRDDVAGDPIDPAQGGGMVAPVDVCSASTKAFILKQLRYRDAGVEAYRIEKSQVSLREEKLGRGGFGVIFAGTWKGYEVAVKILTSPTHSKFILRKELAAWVDVINPDNRDMPGYENGGSIDFGAESAPLRNRFAQPNHFPFQSSPSSPTSTAAPTNGSSPPAPSSPAPPTRT